MQQVSQSTGTGFADCLSLARRSGALRAASGWSRTVDTYVRWFDEFTGGLRPDQVRTVHLAQWAGHLRDSGDSRQTVKNKVGAIGSVLRTAFELGLIPQPVNVPHVRGVKVMRGRVLEEGEEETLLMMLRWFSDCTPAPAADVTIVLLDTGARLGSIWGLDPKEINLEARRVRFTVTKMDRPYEVGLTTRARDILARWMGPPPISIRSYQREFSRAKVAMGLQDDREFVPHMLRHTCATRLVSRGVDLRKVQAHMGHQSIKMTAAYAKVRGKVLNDIADTLEEYQGTAPVLLLTDQRRSS